VASELCRLPVGEADRNLTTGQQVVKDCEQCGRPGSPVWRRAAGAMCCRHHAVRRAKHGTVHLATPTARVQLEEFLLHAVDMMDALKAFLPRRHGRCRRPAAQQECYRPCATRTCDCMPADTCDKRDSPHSSSFRFRGGVSEKHSRSSKSSGGPPTAVTASRRATPPY